MQQPLIGLLASRMQYDIDILDKVATSYTDSVQKAGGIPIILPNIDELMPIYLDMIDGLVLIGGSNDIDPKIYGEENTHSNDVNTQKDILELAIVEQCIEKNIPIFGICRGMQIINLHFGGTLIQHLETELDHLDYKRQNETIHKINVENSRFIPQAEYEVNSIHHQAIKALGNELLITARCSEDDTIEMIEHESLPIFAVQWHPECVYQIQPSEMLFRKLIELSS